MGPMPAPLLPFHTPLVLIRPAPCRDERPPILPARLKLGEGGREGVDDIVHLFVAPDAREQQRPSRRDAGRQRGLQLDQSPRQDVCRHKLVLPRLFRGGKYRHETASHPIVGRVGARDFERVRVDFNADGALAAKEKCGEPEDPRAGAIVQHGAASGESALEQRVDGAATKLGGGVLAGAERHAGLQPERWKWVRLVGLVPREEDHQAARQLDRFPVRLHLGHPVTCAEDLHLKSRRRLACYRSCEEQRGLNVDVGSESHLQS
eukprot:scaffold12670_cov119-Isochrysis_galbana.AAC.1